jgi:hypothetical protein
MQQAHGYILLAASQCAVSSLVTSIYHTSDGLLVISNSKSALKSVRNKDVSNTESHVYAHKNKTSTMVAATYQHDDPPVAVNPVGGVTGWG